MRENFATRLKFDNFCVVASSYPCKSSKDEFIKRLVISPDGTCCLTSSESNFIGSWTFNPDIIDGKKYSNTTDYMLQNYTSVLSLDNAYNVGESIYDFSWYPFMNKNDRTTCCYITTSRDHPIHLWDLNTGSIRCSYCPYNHLDELEAANSVTFNLSGDKIFSGYNKMIRYFDVSNPGRNCTNQATSSSRRDKTDYSGVYAAGSYANSIGIYVENQRDCAMELPQLDFGVTCMRWSPCGRYLWAGGRNHSHIICWDIRSLGGQEIGRVPRPLATNQRLEFDLDPRGGQYLITGSQRNELLVYDTQSFALVARQTGLSDCVNTAAFHPFSSLAVTATGQRHFPTEEEEEEEVDDDDEDKEGVDDPSTTGTLADASTSLSLKDSGGSDAATKGWSGVQLWQIGRSSICLSASSSSTDNDNITNNNVDNSDHYPPDTNIDKTPSSEISMIISTNKGDVVKVPEFPELTSYPT